MVLLVFTFLSSTLISISCQLLHFGLVSCLSWILRYIIGYLFETFLSSFHIRTLAIHFPLRGVFAVSQSCVFAVSQSFND